MANVSTLSIRARLIFSLSLALTVISLVALLITSTLLTDKANHVFDKSLLGAARSIEQRLFVRDGQTRLNMPYFTLDMMESTSAEKVFYRVEHESGELLAGFKGLPIPAGDLSQPHYYSVRFAGNELRAVYLPSNRRGPGTTHIIVAESLHSRQGFANEILYILAAMTGLSALFSVIAAVLAVQQGLQPLKRLRKALQLRTIDDLSPIEQPTPKEVIPLVSGLNQLISRIRDNIDHIQRFNADVSHQLRTPLAEIKTLAHLAQQTADKQSSQAFKQIEQQTDFLTRTTQQLLSYAKTNSNLQHSHHLVECDLKQLSSSTAMALAPNIYQQGKELAFISLSEEPARIKGDSVMLQGLITNLIENALLYAKHQTGNLITVRAGVRQGQALLEVEDQGQGIPEQYLKQVTERFFRLDSNTTGSGLGLAIVQQIADYHQAELLLVNLPEGGLRVSVAFPLLSA